MKRTVTAISGTNTQAPLSSQQMIKADLDDARPSKGDRKTDQVMFLCPICERSLKKTLSYRISAKCEHLFCLQCIEQCIDECIKNGRPLRCMEEGCQRILDETSPAFSEIPGGKQKKYYRTLMNYNIGVDPLTKYCPTVNCNGFVSVQKYDRSIQQWAECYECRKLYCFHCLKQKSKHYQNKSDATIAAQLKTAYGFQRCPSCKKVVQKTQGCDHVTCRCGHHFCYRCGLSWIANHTCAKTDHKATSVIPYTPCVEYRPILRTPPPPPPAQHPPSPQKKSSNNAAAPQRNNKISCSFGCDWATCECIIKLLRFLLVLPLFIMLYPFDLVFYLTLVPMGLIGLCTKRYRYRCPYVDKLFYQNGRWCYHACWCAPRLFYWALK